MTHLLLPSPPPLLIQRSSKPSILLHARRLGRIPNASSNGDPSSTASDAPPSESPPSNNSKPAGVKNRLRSRNQSRRVQLDAPPEELVVPQKKKASAPAPRRERQQPKKWEEMSLAEKALELYVGEKGLLFWLNKFAYASIFIMVGAWILFRFVGPSLGLYQLDAPPLPPTAVFGG